MTQPNRWRAAIAHALLSLACIVACDGALGPGDPSAHDAGSPPHDGNGGDSAAPDAAWQPRDGGSTGDGSADAGGDAGTDASVDAGDGDWPWARTWPGLVFEPTAATPSASFDLPIAGGATVRRLSVEYSVTIGVVGAGDRHQFHFTCADAGHPYRGGLFGFLFLNDVLGNYVFRNGRPGEGATAPTRISFRGAPSRDLHVAQLWDANAGTVSITVTDDGGDVATRTSSEKVDATHVGRAVTTIFSYDTLVFENPAESASIGWQYRDLTVRAAP